MSRRSPRAVGASLDRIEGREKVTGAGALRLRVPRRRRRRLRGGRAVDDRARRDRRRRRRARARAARRARGALARERAAARRAPTTASSPCCSPTGSPTAARSSRAVVAETLETAQQAAALVRVDVRRARAHDVVLRADHPDALHARDRQPDLPEPTPTRGDVDARARDGAEVTVDHDYATPALHNNPMEPHATIARWDERRLADAVRLDPGRGAAHADAIAKAVRPRARGSVRVIAPHVGGGFGSKGTPRPHVVLAAMARAGRGPAGQARADPRSRCSRSPATGRRRSSGSASGADRDGRLTAIEHDVVEQTSTLQEFAEQTAVVTRMLYASPNRRTRHRLARARRADARRGCARPGECPGMFALESAIDELAIELGIDPIELRIANEPEIDPERGQPVLEPAPRRVPARGRRALRLGRARPAARRPPRRRLARRHRRRRLDLPGRRRPSQALARPRAPTARSRCGSRPPTSAPARARCSRQIAADALGVEPRPGARRDRRHRPARPRRSPAARWARRRGARAVVQGLRAAARATPGEPTRRRSTRPTRRRADEPTTPGTRSARSSSRCASTRSPARSAYRARSASSPSGASSTRRRRARSSSAA